LPTRNHCENGRTNNRPQATGDLWRTSFHKQLTPFTQILYGCRGQQLRRPYSTRVCSRIASRPANSGGGEPAPGENGFLILSITSTAYSNLFGVIHCYSYIAELLRINNDNVSCRGKPAWASWASTWPSS
jgi:hypothetical protein